MCDSIFFVLLLMEFSIYEPQKSNSCLASKVWQSGDPELTFGHGCGSISASDIRLSIFARQAVYNGKSVKQNLRPEDLYFIHWQKVIVFVRTMTAISPCSNHAPWRRGTSITHFKEIVNGVSYRNTDRISRQTSVYVARWRLLCVLVNNCWGQNTSDVL